MPEFVTVCCPAPGCGGRLDLFQPREHRPAFVLGCCEDCEAVVLIRDDHAGEGWTISALVPEPAGPGPCPVVPAAIAAAAG